MPPRRPLPDLCVITALKFLEPMDQLTASKMSPRFGPLARAANRQVKTLVITDRKLIKTQRIINSFFISSRPNLQQLTDNRGQAIDLQPKAVRVNRWNCLKFWRNCQEDLPTVEEVATVLFSAVTSLVFIADDYNLGNLDESFQYLVALLQHPHLAIQLESLLLAVDFGFYYEDPEMPALVVLAQLKVLVVKLGLERNEAFFLCAISEQAADNVDLQIHLEDGAAYDLSQYKHTDNWSKSLYSRVVRLGVVDDRFWCGSEICPLFPSLTSISLVVRVVRPSPPNYVPLITALSQHNRQLLHLGWKLDLVDQQNLNPISAPPPRSLPQLTSVQAVTLDLDMADHSQVEWLRLPWTLPNCQAIHLRNFACDRCRVELRKILRGDYYTEHSQPTNSATALQCLRELLSKLYPHFQLQQITLGKGEPYRTAAELFAEHHEQQ
ncbi:hypothetical protein TYRP_009573 [Tyrophagus putrescentiae]|nr:hypothetical protein TYRP_009573 [Tyrophagus putrescentiae]